MFDLSINRDISVWLSLAFIVGGLVALSWSADRFVEAAARVARAFGVSPLIVGMLIIGFGTSAPELAVSVLSALSDQSNLSLGNAYGSCTFNLGVILGVTALLSPIAVIPAEDGRGYYVIDGIGRLNALMAAGVTETEAQIFDLGDLSVAEFVVCKNAMMRKVTTGTRVMAYLKCHEREVLAAADPKFSKLRETSFNGKRGKVSRETLPDKGWNAKEIAERIGVSKNDVLAGIELLKATAEAGEESLELGAKSLEEVQS